MCKLILDLIEECSINTKVQQACQSKKDAIKKEEKQMSWRPIRKIP